MFLAHLLALLIFMSPVALKADDSEFAKSAIKWAEVTGKETIEAFSEEDKKIKFKKIDALIVNNFDIENIGRFVLGIHWRTLNEPLKQRYMEIFKRYSLAMYKSLPLNFSPNISFKVKEAVKTPEDNEDTITVRAIVSDPDKALSFDEESKNSLDLDFRIQKTPEGFKIFDVKLMGASLLLVYRDNFSKMISERHNDIYWFVEDFEDIAYDMEEKIRTEK